MGVWRRLLLAVVCGVAVASIYAAQPVLEPMGRDLGVPAGLTGWIVAAGQVGYLAGLVLLVPLGMWSTGAGSSPCTWRSPRRA